MIEVEISRFGKTWRYLIEHTKNEKLQPRIMKLGLSSEQEAIEEAKKMITNISEPQEEVKWFRK